MAAREIELSEMIGREVDLRTPENLSRYFRDRAPGEAANAVSAESWALHPSLP